MLDVQVRAVASSPKTSDIITVVGERPGRASEVWAPSDRWKKGRRGPRGAHGTSRPVSIYNILHYTLYVLYHILLYNTVFSDAQFVSGVSAAATPLSRWRRRPCGFQGPGPERRKSSGRSAVWVPRSPTHCIAWRRPEMNRSRLGMSASPGMVTLRLKDQVHLEVGACIVCVHGGVFLAAACPV